MNRSKCRLASELGRVQGTVYQVGVEIPFGERDTFGETYFDMNERDGVVDILNIVGVIRRRAATMRPLANSIVATGFR